MSAIPTTSDIPNLKDVSLPQSDGQKARFTNSSSRTLDMHSYGAAFFEKLATDPDSPHTIYLLNRWISVASSLLDFSAKNTVLLSLQDPNAKYATGFDSWNDDHGVRVRSNETAKFLWTPVVEPTCPGCGNAPNRHAQSDCTYNETEPEEWEESVVGFAPGPVFTSDQTQGGAVPQTRKLWDTISPETAATILQNVLTNSCESYFGVSKKLVENPTREEKKEPIPVGLNDNTPPVLNLSQGKSDKKLPLSTETPTDPYYLNATVEIPSEENPEESTLTASVTQLATAILTGKTQNGVAPNSITPDGPLSSFEIEERTVEAEIASHLIADRMGIDPPRPLESIELDSWFGDSHERVCHRLERALTTAEFISRPADLQTFKSALG